LVVLAERTLEPGWGQKSVPNRWNNEIPDQGIGTCQGLLDTASVGAISDVELCGDFLIRQRNQSIAMDRLV